MISEESLKKLKAITLDKGLNLTEEEVLAMGTSLFNLASTVYKPIRKEWVDKLPEEERQKIKV
jgi:hypothetical protein